MEETEELDQCTQAEEEIVKETKNKWKSEEKAAEATPARNETEAPKYETRNLKQKTIAERQKEVEQMRIRAENTRIERQRVGQQKQMRKGKREKKIEDWEVNERGEKNN